MGVVAQIEVPEDELVLEYKVRNLLWNLQFLSM